jgi:hypothetical protein
MNPPTSIEFAVRGLIHTMGSIVVPVKLALLPRGVAERTRLKLAATQECLTDEGEKETVTVCVPVGGFRRPQSSLRRVPAPLFAARIGVAAEVPTVMDDTAVMPRIPTWTTK